jgi:hypothetical protein
VHGIWFYDQAELSSVAVLLNRVKSGLPSQPDANAQVGVSAQIIEYRPFRLHFESVSSVTCRSHRRSTRGALALQLRQWSSREAAQGRMTGSGTRRSVPNAWRRG